MSSGNELPLLEAILYLQCQFQGPHFSAPLLLYLPLYRHSHYSVLHLLFLLHSYRPLVLWFLWEAMLFLAQILFFYICFLVLCRTFAGVSGYASKAVASQMQDFLVVASGLMSTVTSVHAVPRDGIFPCILQVIIHAFILQAHTLFCTTISSITGSFRGSGIYGRSLFFAE